MRTWQVPGGLREPRLYADGVGTVVSVGPPPLVTPDPLDSIGNIEGRRVVWSGPNGYETNEVTGERILYRVVSPRRLGSALRESNHEIPDRCLNYLYVLICEDNEWQEYSVTWAIYEKVLAVFQARQVDPVAAHEIYLAFKQEGGQPHMFWVPTHTLWLD